MTSRIRPDLLSAVCSLLFVSAAACTAVVPPQPDSDEFRAPLVFGRAVTVIMGDLSRIYPPEIRFLEVASKKTGRRMQIELESQDKVFVVPLAVGDYELTRVQISEGPFLSLADFAIDFQVIPNQLTYVGTWRFGIESPQYGRMIVLSAVNDSVERARAETELRTQFPHLTDFPIGTAELSPAQAETRLYEVMPYPRYPRYFRRHWW